MRADARSRCTWALGGRVSNGVTAEDRTLGVRWPVPSYPGYFHAVDGVSTLAGPNGSSANDSEARVAIATVRWFVEQGVPMPDIGVIATYKAQVHLIASHASQAGMDGLSVNTVDAYQGQERAVIIISLVRADQRSLKFLEHSARLNVAATRCQRGRVFLGHPSTLRRARSIASGPPLSP